MRLTLRREVHFILGRGSSRGISMMVRKEDGNKLKILKCLIESQKTTPEIAISLGYVTTYGTAKQGMIGNQLKDLVKCKYIKVKHLKNEFGKKINLYKFNISPSSLNKLLKEHPALITDIIKNKEINNIILHNYKNTPIGGHNEFKSVISLSQCMLKLLYLSEIPPETFIQRLDTVYNLHIVDHPFIKNYYHSLIYHCYVDDLINDVLNSEFEKYVKNLFF